MKFETFLGASALSVGFLMASTAHAVPVVDGGWASDEVLAAGAPSVGSSYVFSLTGDTYFRITDAFVVGDSYSVYNFGALLVETSFQAFGAGFGDNFAADNGWTDASYGSAEILLGAGDYNLVVTGDGAGGLSAGFFTRLDSVAPVPLPASMGFLGLAIGGLGLMARRKS